MIMSTGLLPEIGRFRLACSVPHPEDGTSFYRAMGPLGAMVKEEPRLDLSLPRPAPGGWDLGWDWLSQCHAAFLQRPFHPVHLQFCKLVKAMNMPLWVDWDDDVRCIPHSNPYSASFGDTESVRDCIWQICQLADVVTCATLELCRRMRATARVIPNALHFKFYNEPRQRRISWRGAAGHEEDLVTILPQLGELSRLPQLSMWRWLFLGDVAWQVEEAIAPALLETVPGAVLQFMVPLLALQGPYVHIVPLKSNSFNLCKSNIAWIEATCAGAVVLAPDLEEWRRPGIINYTDPKDFQVKLRALMQEYRDGAMHPGVYESRAYLQEQLRLDQVNQARWQILNELWPKRPLI